MTSYYEWPHDYGGDIAIKSHLTKDEAVKRLRAITREVPGCFALAFSTSRKNDPELIGVILGDTVRLARAPTFISNAAKPIFYGSFVESEGLVTLRGRFGVNCSQKLSFWSSSAIVGLFEIAFVIGIFLPENSPLLSWRNMEMIFTIPALGAILLAATYHWTKKMVKSDREWVERELREALVASR